MSESKPGSFTDIAFDSGRIYEQDRIIKALDNWRCGHPNCDGDKTEVCYPKHYLIELIKEKVK